MAAYAALVSLMNNVEQIQGHTRLPIRFDQKQSESLLEKVNFWIHFLESYNYHGAGEEIKDLESRIRDAAYAAEDIIETHVVDKIHSHSRSNHLTTGQAEKNLTPSCLPNIEKVMEDMEFIKEKAMKMKENSALEITTPPLSTSFPLLENTMVGFKDMLLELMKRLAENKCNRQIIPIVGMGGIGKTTLTRTAYEKSFTVNHFDFRAWVSISQVYDFKSIVLGLLPNESSQSSDNELAQRLHKSLCTHDDSECIHSQRRISFHQSASSEKNISQILDTLKSGSMSRTLICDNQLGVLPLQNFKLMRVLCCINTRTYDVARYSLNFTFQQVNSRLLMINYITGPTPFPSSLCLLWNLQILIVTQMRENIIAPLEIWEMTKLRHLQFSWGLHLPEPPTSKQMNGQESDITMKKLHTLKGIKDFRLGDEVVKRIPNIKKLNICYELNGKELEGWLKNLGLLENLESLRLLFEQQAGSDLLSNFTLPDSLKKLTLIGCGFPWEDMSTIASLPHLEVLYLISNAFIGPKWELDEEEVFCCLKSLEISYCPDLVHWIADDMNFPRLEYLVLVLLDELEEIPSGVGDIPTLQRIELLDCNKSAVISAKSILEEQVSLGNRSLQIKVRCTEDAEIESLASENFQVRVWDE